VQKQLASCTRYKVNLAAEKMGQCMCGSLKAEHSAAALAACDDKGKVSKTVDEEELRATFVQREKVSCVKFVVNLQSARFGECQCGSLRTDHSAAALKAGKAKANALVDGAELRKTFVQKEMASCPKYAVNMLSSRFGECTCGLKRSEHTAEALGADGKSSANLVDSDALHKKFTSTETVECELFEIDMRPEVPFGQCLCGETRQKHSSAALQPRRRGSKEASMMAKEIIAMATGECDECDAGS